MRKLVVALVLVLGIGAVAVMLLGLALDNSSKDSDSKEFGLSQEYYERGELKEVTAEEFGRLIEGRQSFIVIARMAVCPAEFPLKDVAKQVAKDEGVVIFELNEVEFKETPLAQVVKYLPSAAIYHNGELVTYLDAEKDEDLQYYQTAEGFKDWLANNGVKL